MQTNHTKTWHNKTRWNPRELDLAVLMYENNIDIQSIAKHMGRTEASVYTKLWYKGVVGTKNADVEVTARPVQLVLPEAIKRKPKKITVEARKEPVEARKEPVEAPKKIVEAPEKPVKAFEVTTLPYPTAETPMWLVAAVSALTSASVCALINFLVI